MPAIRKRVNYPENLSDLLFRSHQAIHAKRNLLNSISYREALFKLLFSQLRSFSHPQYFEKSIQSQVFQGRRYLTINPPLLPPAEKQSSTSISVAEKSLSKVEELAKDITSFEGDSSSKKQRRKLKYVMKKHVPEARELVFMRFFQNSKARAAKSLDESHPTAPLPFSKKDLIRTFCLTDETEIDLGLVKGGGYLILSRPFFPSTKMLKKTLETHQVEHFRLKDNILLIKPESAFAFADFVRKGPHNLCSDL